MVQNEKQNKDIPKSLHVNRKYKDSLFRIAFREKENLDIFSGTLQKLPFPQYYVLYNGEKDEADRKMIELKNAFPRLEGMEPCLNCTATLLNINYGHNREIMKRSRTLRDYSIYVQRIRDNRTLGMNLEEAVERATEDSIRDGVLKDILLKNSAEVKNMVLGEWGTQNHIRKQKEEQEQLEWELEQKRNELKEKQSENERLRNELKKALTDESYRKKLLEEYQL